MSERVTLRFRKPESCDAEALYTQKNDPLVTGTLGGFSRGYSRRDIDEWIERTRVSTTDLVFSICVDGESCIGHLGLYEVDHRVRSAEFGVMIGDRRYWGKGVGTECVKWCLRFGFEELALHRIHLSVLDLNPRAIALYERCGFSVEGRHRDVQWRSDRWWDSVSMSILEGEWRDRAI